MYCHNLYKKEQGARKLKFIETFYDNNINEVHGKINEKIVSKKTINDNIMELNTDTSQYILIKEERKYKAVFRDAEGEQRLIGYFEKMSNAYAAITETFIKLNIILTDYAVIKLKEGEF